jgi:hypothetical protein
MQSKIIYTNKKELLEKIETDKNWWLLMAASDELKNDREVVLEAIKHNWACLQYASDNLKRDKEIVLFARKQSANEGYNAHVFFHYADYEFFKNDKEFMNEIYTIKSDHKI